MPNNTNKQVSTTTTPKKAVVQTPGQQVEQVGAAAGGYYGAARHPLPLNPGYYDPRYSIPVRPSSTSSSVDVTISELVLAASTSPAIAAVQATTLNICDNRILMQDVASDWPAIYVSGDEIAIKDNWIGLNDNTDAENYASPAMTDAQGSTITSTVPATWTGNGGVQVGGFSTGVEIVNNQIEGGAFNGITLGGILQLQNGTSTGGLNGLFLASPVTSNMGTTLVRRRPAATISSVRMDRCRTSASKAIPSPVWVCAGSDQSASLLIRPPRRSSASAT